jgi:hypothetical protein
MPHLGARFFRSVLLAATLVAMVAAPAAAGPAPVVSAAGTTADTPSGTASATKADQLRRRLYSIDAGGASASGQINVDENGFSAQGLLFNRGARRSRSQAVFLFVYTRGSLGQNTRRFEYWASNRPVKTELGFRAHPFSLVSATVVACHHPTGSYDRNRSRCTSKQVFP